METNSGIGQTISFEYYDTFRNPNLHNNKSNIIGLIRLIIFKYKQRFTIYS